MISIVTYGRNDNYGYNLAKRAALGLNCLAEVLTEEDEILFVDYNTPDHLPTLPEFLWDTLTTKALGLIRVIRISRELHEKIKGDSPIPILENVSRNAAIIRSDPRNHWILSTNPDVLLILSSRWQNLGQLTGSLPDSFYEMPRFDIPESVWSSLCRSDPRSNMTLLHNWLVSNKLAVVETIPDWRYQKYLLFDAPGDFQLAPRDFFFRIRGFDESMNKYLHSDSNLAKRMWLLNNERTDHLLGHVWVLHQDHYLSGEWAKNLNAFSQNDIFHKVVEQDEVQANESDWGLQGLVLPMFSLAARVEDTRVSFEPASSLTNGDLPLSKEVDWRTEPVYRLFHYDAEVLKPYLRENLRVAPPESRVMYVGKNSAMLDCAREIWNEVSPSGLPLGDISDFADRGELANPDLLLVDFYTDRTAYWDRRVRLKQQTVQWKLGKGQISEYDAGQRINDFVEPLDTEEWEDHLVEFWLRIAPYLQIRSGITIILLGCSQFVRPFARFRELFSNRYVGAKLNRARPRTLRSLLSALRGKRLHAAATSDQHLMGPAYFDTRLQSRSSSAPAMEFEIQYVHHRLVVLRVS